MKIRCATIDDLSALYALENKCFSPEESPLIEEFEERLVVYPNHFWILEDNNNLIGFINGMVTNEQAITDDMFKNAHLHDENGKFQAIFGVNTAVKYRRRGYAAKIMEQLIADSKKQGRKGCILNCKEELIKYYEKFGYKNDGISKSVLAGEVWYDMSLIF